MEVFRASNRMTVTLPGACPVWSSRFEKTRGGSAGCWAPAGGAAIRAEKSATCCGCPWSRIEKSSLLRSSTGCPFLSRTTTLICTKRVVVRMTAGTGVVEPGFWVCASRGSATAVRRHARRAARNVFDTRHLRGVRQNLKIAYERGPYKGNGQDGAILIYRIGRHGQDSAKN